MRFVYVVRCNDATLYTGIAKDVYKRVDDHNNSAIGAKYTKARRPVVLVWHKKVKDRVVAAKMEYKIKRLGREQKEMLLDGKKITSLLPGTVKKRKVEKNI